MPAKALYAEGVRESVLNGCNRWLIAPNSDPAGAFDRAWPRVTSPEDEGARVGRSVLWASMFTWSRRAERMAGVVLDEMERELRRQVPGRPTLTAPPTADPQSLSGDLPTQLVPPDQLVMGEGTVVRLLKSRHGHWIAILPDELREAEFTIRRVSDSELLVGPTMGIEQLIGGLSRV